METISKKSTIEKYNIGDYIRIKNNDLKSTENAHGCEERMFELKGRIFEIVNINRDETGLLINDIINIENQICWYFHPNDVERVDIKEIKKDSQPIKFDLKNLYQ